MLLAVVLMVFLVLIALAVAAPVVARDLRRDKEIESQHRMEQYVRAIQLYQRKMGGQYPASIKVLENTNNIRFLRHQYVDPLTGKADYKLIHQGEQKTKIHVFFGEELAGLAANLGSASGLQSGGGMGTPIGGGSTNVTSTNALNSGFGGASIGDTGNTSGAPSTNGTTTSGTSSASGSNNNTGMFGDSTGGVIVGVGTSRSGNSITEPNGQTTYETWEFWYDPRIEQLKQGVNVTGGGMSSQSASSFGQNGVTGQSNSGTNGSNGFGSNGFGSNGSNGFGSSGFGSNGNGSTGTNGSTGSSNPNSSTPNPF